MENQNNIVNNPPKVGGLLPWIQIFTSVFLGLIFVLNLFSQNASNDRRLTKLEANQELISAQFPAAITDVKTELVRLRTILEESREKKKQ